jgi:hypothetical protein
MAATAAASVCLLLAACGSTADTQSSSAAPSTSREAGFVTLPVVLCIENGTTEEIDIAPTGPYGEFTQAKPGERSCIEGDTTAGDPVAAITFGDDSVIYAYGRNPVMGRPDIRLCGDQDCGTSYAQYDLSVGAKLSGKVKGRTYTATRSADASDKKQLQLRVS